MKQMSIKDNQRLYLNNVRQAAEEPDRVAVEHQFAGLPDQHAGRKPIQNKRQTRNMNRKVENGGQPGGRRKTHGNTIQIGKFRLFCVFKKEAGTTNKY